MRTTGRPKKPWREQLYLLRRNGSKDSVLDVYDDDVDAIIIIIIIIVYCNYCIIILLYCSKVLEECDTKKNMAVSGAVSNSV
jgi:hypothetical protein